MWFSGIQKLLRRDVDGEPCEEEPSVIYALPPSAGEGDRRIRLDETSTSTPKKRSLREVRKGTPKPTGRAPSSSSDEDMSGESSSESESSSDEEESVAEAVKAVAPIAQTQENEPSSPTSSSSSSSSESESSSDESSAASEPTPQPKRRKVEAAPAPVHQQQQEVIGNDKVRFVAARKPQTPPEEEAKESNWKFDDWHEKVEDLRAGQFVKFRSLQADPVTGRSKLLEPEVWKLLALDNGKAVLVDCKGRHDVIPEKDMFGLLVHDPEENAPSAGEPQQQQQQQQKQKQIGQHVASPANKKGPKISSLAYVPPIASDKSALKRQKKKFGSIRRQVEWWLNKPNWEKDEHLRSLAYPGTHWVPVHELMKFDRLRDLSDDQAEVVHIRGWRCRPTVTTSGINAGPRRTQLAGRRRQLDMKKWDRSEDTPWVAEADRDQTMAADEQSIHAAASASQSSGENASPPPPDYPAPPPVTIAVDIIETPRMSPADEVWNAVRRNRAASWWIPPSREHQAMGRESFDNAQPFGAGHGMVLGMDAIPLLLGPNGRPQIGPQGNATASPLERALLQQVLMATFNHPGIRSHATSPSVLSRFRDVTATREDEQDECAICQCRYVTGDVLNRIRDAIPRDVPCSCRHAFHKHCIRPWLEQHNSCPVCRFELPSDSS
ncbi:hypothetical protein FOZ61_010755 [Perkinsus olseni]|uniref:RING-type domain-containing protein n=1 Tax=Perkinsus olseni TaxID=32597 RepID=A0A7J6KXH2_PEROL|nr:hypothetical protein FOZ61_010755 [Perkinsus olseni]